MANQAKGQARDFAFLASGKLCFSNYKSSSLYALSLYGTNHCFLLPIPSSFPCQASCVDSKTSLVFAGHAVPRSVLSS